MRKITFILVLVLFIQQLFAQVPTITSFSPTTAGPGDTITIIGTNFTPWSYPVIGSIATGNEYISSTILLAIIGTNATSGSITVFNLNNVSSNTLPGFIFSGTPVITSVTPATAGFGDTVTLTGKYLAPALVSPTINFGGVSASSILPLSVSVVKAILGNGASGDVVLGTSFGSATYSGFIYNPVNFKASPVAGCYPLTVNFTNVSVGTWAAWTWDFGDGETALTAFPPSHTYIKPGTYTVKLTGISSTDIMDTVIKVNYITVYNIPTVSLTSSAQNTFVGAVTTYTTQGNQSNYQWVLSDTLNTGYTIISGGTTTDSSISVKWLKTGNETVKVDYNNSNGCSGNPATVNTSVTALPMPIINSFSPVIATTGTTVTITGRYLTHATAVNFGGTATESFSVLNDSTISAIVGTGATGNISVIIFVDSTTIPGFTFVPLPIPIISSFSPASGQTGTAVTITGTNFNTTAANNIVYFGAVRAGVTSATDTTLNVIVPAGASYLPITVTVGGLTAYSTLSFDVTFNNAIGAIITDSLFNKTDFISTSVANESIGDIDGDGKPDIISVQNNTLSVLRNLSTPGHLFFSASIDLVSNISLGAPVVADIDGDGKLDIITANYNNSTVSIFRNTSTPGDISFAQRVDISTAPYLSYVAVGDIDGDGRPDLVVGNSYLYYQSSSSRTISLFKNLSTPGNITNTSFATRVDFAYINSSYYGFPQLCIKDLDNDGKPDILSEDGYGKLSIFHNTSSLGTIDSNSLAAAIVPSVNIPGALTVSDINNDDKPDIITASGGTILISQNKTTPDSINGSSFQTPIPFSFIGGDAGMPCVADINGDGKPDIAAGTDTSKLFILTNLLTSSTINSSSFLVNRIFDFGDAAAFTLSNVNINDMDGDGKPDIIVGHNNNIISIFRNTIGEPAIDSICPNGTVTITSSLTGNSYQWQLSTDSVHYTNIGNNANYSGTNNNALTLNNIPSAWYGYEYRCVVDGTNSSVYTLKFTDTWIGTTDSTWENAANWSCGTVPDSNTDVIINSGTVVLRSNVAVRSLTVSPNANFTVITGNKLTITH